MKKIITISLDEKVVEWIDSRRGDKKRSPFIEEKLKVEMWNDEMLYA